jgi:hypothetical protein
MFENQLPPNRPDYAPKPETAIVRENVDRKTSSDIEKQLEMERALKSGANWFFWIGGLSLINSVIILLGSEWGFIIGLGMTQIIDSIAFAFARTYGTNIPLFLALFADVVIAGAFVLIGYFARQKKEFAFIAGLAFYAVDAGLFLLAIDIFGLGFHLLALIFIYKGYQALSKMKKAGQLAAPPVPAGIPEEMVK